MSKVLILGAGLMGRALAYDLCRQKEVSEVLVTDLSDERLREAKKIVASPKARFENCSIEDRTALRKCLKGAKLTFGAVSYQFNRMLTEECIKAGSHFVDLGGNDAVVDAQFALGPQAKKAGVTIVPDCGLAPGLAGILGMHVYRQFDTCDELHLRVGGLPQHPKPPLDYMLVFSVHGLVNEYKEPVRVMENGKLKTVAGMSGLETLEFPKPFGTMEAFYTSGGVSTLVKTLKGKVKNLDYKTIRYTGHQQYIKFLLDAGFFDEKKCGLGVTPRDVTEDVLKRHLTIKDDDLILVRVWGSGKKAGKNKLLCFECVDYQDKKTGLTAMMRMTAFPAAIIGHMLLTGAIKERGTLFQELVVPVPELIAELKKRKIEIVQVAKPTPKRCLPKAVKG